MVEAVQADIPNAPILDLGCGRGEWLELLKAVSYTHLTLPTSDLV